MLTSTVTVSETIGGETIGGDADVETSSFSWYARGLHQR